MTTNDQGCHNCGCGNGDSDSKEQMNGQEQQIPVREPVILSITDVELASLKGELNEYKDKYLRLLADAENARKRLQRERKEIIDSAVQNAVIDLLHPLDHLENALKFAKEMSDEIKQWAFGFEMILTQFRDALASSGIVTFESMGKAFDPHLHEAVEAVETDSIPPGIIIEECARGYKMGERVIRPARVKVAKAHTPK